MKEMRLINHVKILGLIIGVSIVGPSMPVHGQSEQKWRIAYRLAKNVDAFDKQDPLGAYAYTEFAPDGKTIAAGYHDGSVSLFDARDGSVRMKLTGHKSPVRYVEFSRDGKKLLTREKNGEVLIWQPNSGKLLCRINQSRQSDSEDGRYVARNAAFSPDGKYVITNGLPRLVRVWNVERPLDPPAILGSVKQWTRLGKFSPDGRWIATAYEPVILWDRPSLRVRHEIFKPADIPDNYPRGHLKGSYYFAFSPDGKVLARSIAGVLDILDVKTGKRIARWPTQYKQRFTEIFGLAWSPDSKHIAVTQVGIDKKGPLIIEARTMRVITHLTIPDEQQIAVLQFSPDGRQIAGGRITRDIFQYNPVSSQPADDLVWDVKTGMVIAKLKSPIGTRPIFSPDGEKIVNTSQHPTVWELHE